MPIFSLMRWSKMKQYECILARVRRENPQSGEVRFQDYPIQTDREMNVMMILSHIFRHMDSTLAYRDYECYRGVCMSCLLKINGTGARGCSTIVKPGETVVLEPPDGHKVIKDLVYDY